MHSTVNNVGRRGQKHGKILRNTMEQRLWVKKYNEKKIHYFIIWLLYELFGKIMIYNKRYRLSFVATSLACKNSRSIKKSADKLQTSKKNEGSSEGCKHCNYEFYDDTVHCLGRDLRILCMTYLLK